MNWQPGQEYKTRDGRRARVYAVEAVGEWPIHGAHFLEGVWRATAWRTDGKWYETLDSTNDLMPPLPVKHVYWLNVYENGHISTWTEKHLANEHAGRSRIACLRIEFEEGEGL